MKLVDTKDLKSLPYGSASSSLAEGTKLLMNKLHFIFDETKKAQQLKKLIFKNYKNYSVKNCKAIIVGGGDGFMLSNLKKYSKLKKPFYGINCGTFGFLMNNYVVKKIEDKIFKAKKTLINPLEMSFKNNKIIAINEISFYRQSKQTTSIKIEIGKKTIIKKLIGDGVLISTPAGSTAYNLSANGPVLSLNSGKLAITPISPFRPRRWKGKTVSNKSIIKITNLDYKKRPISAVADNVEIKNIKSVSVKVNKSIKLNLLFDPNRSLFKRIKKEQVKINKIN